MLDCVDARTSRAVTRTRSPARKIEPSSTASTPSSRAISGIGLLVARYRRLDVRAVTRSAPSCPSSVIIASVTPSARVLRPGAWRQIGEGENGERVDGRGCGRQAGHDPTRGRDKREEGSDPGQHHRDPPSAWWRRGLGRRFQRGADLPRLLVALAGVLPQAPLDDGAQLLRHMARQVGCWCLQDRRADVGGSRTAERAPSGQQLEQHHAERPDVTARIGIAAADPLGRHVGQRPADRRRGALR